MYSRTIFKIIGLFLLTLALQSTLAANHGAIRIKALKQFATLKSKIHSEKQLYKKLNQLQRFTKDIEGLRAKSGRQSEVDEIFLDRLIEGLNLIPEAKDFKFENCPKYKANLIFQFDPQQEDEPKEPGTKDAFEILTILCARSSTK